MYYCATARSNYFRVRDAAKFKDFCTEVGLTFENDQRDGETYYMIRTDDTDCGGWPSVITDDDGNDTADLDLGGELADHLDPRDIAVLMEAGAEGYCSVDAYAVAIRSDRETCRISIQDIYSLAKEKLGPLNITRAER